MLDVLLVVYAHLCGSKKKRCHFLGHSLEGVGRARKFWMGRYWLFVTEKHEYKGICGKSPWVGREGEGMLDGWL